MANEKIPRLLSAEECQSLLGDLRSLGLPESARLYLVAGLPQVFERLSFDQDECFEDSWLYVPLSQVKSLRQNVIVEASRLSRSGISRHSVRSEGTKLYPIVCNGEFAGFLSVPSGEPVKLDDQLMDSLLERLETHFDQSRYESSSIVKDFVNRLYRRDQAFHEFLKAALRLITDQWDRSMGAIYYDNDGIYSMRMALGDIQYGDVLPSEVKQATARDWVDAIRRGEYVIPADLMPDSPTFLSAPPTFVFVHPAISSTRTEYLLTVAVSGDISRQAIAKVREVAGLIADLDESQFATSSDLLDLYGRLGETVHAAPVMDEILLDVFKRLSGQISISRMLLANSGGPASKVKQRHQKEPEFLIEPTALIADEAIEAVTAGRSLLLEDVRRQFGKSELGKRYYLDNVASELVFPMRWTDQEWSLLAIGTPLPANYLEEHRRLLELAARYLEICLMFIHRGWWQRQVDLDESDLSSTGEDSDMSRMSSRLADGILHAMLEQLSVVLGQGEIMEEELSTAAPGEERSLEIEGTRRINHAATAMADFIEHLRWLQRQMDPRTNNESVALSQLAAEIPAVLSGCIRDLMARKRIEIAVRAECPEGENGEVSRRAVATTVLPLIVTLLDESICSGDVVVRCRTSDSGPEVSCEFSGSLVGHLDIMSLIERVYPRHRAAMGGEQAGRISLSKGVLDYTVDDGRYRLNYTFAQAPDNKGTSHPSGPKKVVR